MNNNGIFTVLKNKAENYIIVYIEKGKTRELTKYNFEDWNSAVDFIEENKEELDNYVTSLKVEEQRQREALEKARREKEEADRIAKEEEEKKKKERSQRIKTFIIDFVVTSLILTGGHFAAKGISTSIKENKGNSKSITSFFNRDNKDSDFTYNYDENAVVVNDTEYEELTTEKFEDLTATTILEIENLGIKVSREDIIKYVMFVNNDQLCQDNTDLVGEIMGEQTTDEVLLDALNVIGARTDAIRAAYNRGEDITKYFTISNVVFNEEQKAMTQEVEKRLAEVISLADDTEKFNEELKTLLLDLWNSDSGIYAMESGAGYNLQIILKSFREIYGTVLNKINEENMQILVRLVSNAGDRQEDKDNCMASAYYRQAYTNINGTCEKVLKRG